MNIYNFSKNVIQNLIKENKNNSSFIPILLVLFSIPLSFAINNIALGIFLLVAFFTLKKENLKLQKDLVFPLNLSTRNRKLPLKRRAKLGKSMLIEA